MEWLLVFSMCLDANKCDDKDEDYWLKAVTPFEAGDGSEIFDLN